MKNEEISLRTKRELATTLKELMLQKPFNKITVSEIIGKNGINRKTFYYHFRDIYDLLCWMMEQETTLVVKKLCEMQDYRKAIDFVFDYIGRNSHIILCALDSNMGDVIHRFFVDGFHDISLSIIRDLEKRYGVTIDETHRGFLGAFFSEATAGMIIEWIRTDHGWSQEMASEYYLRIVSSSLRAVLESEGKKIG